MHMVFSSFAKLKKKRGVHAMKQVCVELIADEKYGGFTARLPDIPAYGEGETEAEAIADLKEALAAYIESFGLEDALARLQSPVTIRSIDLDLAELTRG
jgi:predicted RNase H-like HicB family nuclease